MRGRCLIAVLVLVSAGASAAPLLAQPSSFPADEAGDSPGEATEIQEGHVQGTLLPAGESDWYVLPTPIDRAICYQAKIQGTAYADATLSLTQGLAPAVTRTTAPGLVLDLGLAAPTTFRAFLGLTPASVSEAQTTSFGIYDIDLQAFTIDELGPGDAGTSEDAGGDAETAIQVPAPCLAGELDAETDTVDTYTFQADRGEHVALSLAQAAAAPVRLVLTSPSGDQVSRLENGGFADATVNETGQYRLTALIQDQASQQIEVDYMIGITINGPEPPPCHPTCLTSGG